MTPRRWDILRALADAPGWLTVTEVAASVDLHRASVWAALDELAEEGLVEHRGRPGCRGLYRATAAGLRVADQPRPVDARAVALELARTKPRVSRLDLEAFGVERRRAKQTLADLRRPGWLRVVTPGCPGHGGRATVYAARDAHPA